MPSTILARSVLPGLLDALEQRGQAVGGRLLATGRLLVEVLLHPAGDGELRQRDEAADVPRRDGADLGRRARQLDPALVAGGAGRPDDVRVPARARVAAVGVST